MELMSSTVNEAALAVMNRQGTQGIKIVRMQMKFIFDI